MNLKRSEFFRQKFYGAMYGLFVCDALGAFNEFKDRATVDENPISDMQAGGPFDLAAGDWTDDSSNALCIADSLIEQGRYNPSNIMSRLSCWMHDGYLSSIDVCFDVGGQTKAAIRMFDATPQNPYPGQQFRDAAGNGPLMRLAPLPLVYWETPGKAMRVAGRSAQMTHGHEDAYYACKYFAGLLILALQGKTKEEILAPFATPDREYNPRHYSSKIFQIARGDYRRKDYYDLQNTGWIVTSLEAALWCFWASKDFEHGALLAVNMGGDSDTIGAIYGQIAGTYYGLGNIPARWVGKLTKPRLLRQLVDDLWATAQGKEAPIQDV